MCWGGASSAVTSVLHGPIKEQGFENNHGLVDAVFIGEGEYSIKQFLEIVKKGKAQGLRKTEILNTCHGKVDGFYEPDKYEHRYKVVVQNPPEIQTISEKICSEQKETHVDQRFTKKSSLDSDLGDENTPTLSPPSQGGNVGG